MLSNSIQNNPFIILTLEEVEEDIWKRIRVETAKYWQKDCVLHSIFEVTEINQDDSARILSV